MKPFVDFNTYNVNNPFGAVNTVFYPATHHHIGSDFVVPIGTPILAPADGEVIKTIFNQTRGNTAIFDFYHGGEWGLEFCHLKELPPLGKFKQGDVIAYSGNTGSATTGAHLHVTMHKNCLVTKDYELLTSSEAYQNLVTEGQLIDPHAWFQQHLSS